MLHRTLSDAYACANVKLSKAERPAHKAGQFDGETIASKNTIFGLETE